jgi:DNA-binding transcriptional MerR regulator
VTSIDDIPNKKYYKIGEVCDLTGIKSHTLRYWETEFKLLKPHRANSKQRLYRRVDIANIILIKKLIQDDGLTIAGTKKALAKGNKSNKKTQVVETDFLRTIKSELISIKKILA